MYTWVCFYWRAACTKLLKYIGYIHYMSVPQILLRHSTYQSLRCSQSAHHRLPIGHNSSHFLVFLPSPLYFEVVRIFILGKGFSDPELWHLRSTRPPLRLWTTKITYIYFWWLGPVLSKILVLFESPLTMSGHAYRRLRTTVIESKDLISCWCGV